ncbi:Acetyl esterase/lipase [Mycolicibacterium fluoranthenivorans]|uniref:Acetyl esterase/lipase n=1 Tax=Mycolicibacterium fluoranthenivorans TaxID=258505 RepID=A0A1G4WVX6_9MYCO|nr:Acetyl esterase/lipase [Mycolicibacterium fluoranthenivorans]
MRVPSPVPDVVYHPDLARIARFIPRRLVGPQTAPVMQYLSRRMGRSVPDGVEVLTLSSGVTLRLHRPRGVAKPGPALLWMHGGGYVLGSPAQDDKLCRRYAGELGATVAAVQYRLAPQNPYPAGLDDCYAALTWLAQLPTVDPSRLAIGGASAGGGMAAALALLARDRGEVPLAAQVLVYPMLDDRTVGPEFDDPGHRLWTQGSNGFGWRAYLGGADPEVAVPARNPDLSGLPPAWIGVGTHDLFHDEDLAYAQRLREAGVPVEVEVVAGAFHGFDAIAPKTAVSQDFIGSQIATLRRAFTAAP